MRTLLQIRFIGIITSRYYLSDRNVEMIEQIKMKGDSTKADRELVKHNARLAKCSLKVAENLAEYHDEERGLVKRNAILAKVILSWLKVWLSVLMMMRKGSRSNVMLGW